MNLGQMRTEVRRAIDEPTADFWADSELNDWLNEGAKLMVSESQPVQTFYQLACVAGQQEYNLPSDVDEVFDAKLWIGSLLPLSPTSPRGVQEASQQPGQPEKFYVREIVAQTAGQGSNNNITVTPSTPTWTSGGGKVIGFYPTPSSSAWTVTLSYFSAHYTMVNDTDVSPVPLEYHRGIVAYATAIAKQKDEAYSEMSDIYMPIFEKFRDRLKVKMMNAGQELTHPKIQVLGEEDYYSPNTSIIIIPEGSAS
ncbi:MAG TPA: hypothetical protein V6C86_24135 [Oculatellaceae cyanobacterium]